jgi:NTP pyrophosphatase (non-canonical NTP hydrolase)
VSGEGWYDPGLDVDAASKYIDAEDGNQIRKWGTQTHTAQGWGIIVAEEFGELIHAINDYYFEHPGDPLRHLSNIQKEAVQLATLALKVRQMAGREMARRTP